MSDLVVTPEDRVSRVAAQLVQLSSSEMIFFSQNALDHARLKCLITKTCPCNVYPLEPHFYIAQLGYEGVYLFFLFLLQNINCGFYRVPTIYVLTKNKKKYQNFSVENFQFLKLKKSLFIAWASFRNVKKEKKETKTTETDPGILKLILES